MVRKTTKRRKKNPLRMQRSGNYFIRLNGRDYYLGRDEYDAGERRVLLLRDYR